MRYRETVEGELGEPDGPDDRDPDRMFDYVERFAAVLVAAGFPAMPARVFVALLVAESGRLSAAELAGRLRVSPAAVPGSRRDYYRMPGTMWDDLLRMRDQVMSRWAALVREGIGLVGPDTAAGARMAEQAAFLDFATREMSDLLTRWEKYRAEHGPGSG